MVQRPRTLSSLHGAATTDFEPGCDFKSSSVHTLISAGVCPQTQLFIMTMESASRVMAWWMDEPSGRESRAVLI